MATAPDRIRRPHGRMVDCVGGYRAYLPAPLPPPMAWDTRLTVALSAADRAIGRLAGEGRRLPNPHLLIQPFVRKEAVQSSRIEGTQATLGELLADEAGAAVERDPADVREVGNYVVALEYGLGRAGFAAAVAAARARGARATHAGRPGRHGDPRGVPTQPELDRVSRVDAEPGHLRTAAARGAHGLPRRLGDGSCTTRRCRRWCTPRSRTPSSRRSTRSSTATAG